MRQNATINIYILKLKSTMIWRVVAVDFVDDATKQTNDRKRVNATQSTDNNVPKRIIHNEQNANIHQINGKSYGNILYRHAQFSSRIKCTHRCDEKLLQKTGKIHYIQSRTYCSCIGNALENYCGCNSSQHPANSHTLNLWSYLWPTKVSTEESEKKTTTER